MIDILLIGSLHHKNINALQKYKNIKLHSDWRDIDQCTVILSPKDFIPIECENKVYIFGPHFSVFPDHKFALYLNNWKKNAIFNLLSNWCVNLWSLQTNCNNITDKVTNIPFGVDTERFIEVKPVSNRDGVFIYYKHRDPSELCILQNFLDKKGVKYKMFNYDTKYDENEYLSYLQNSKYGIILDAHESQGFAIEEALSCNVPLFVWNVSSMKQEYGTNYLDYAATSIPYWDDRCGEYFYNAHELEKAYDEFISNLDKYKPREFILETLSIEKCEEKLINLINHIKSKM